MIILDNCVIKKGNMILSVKEIIYEIVGWKLFEIKVFFIKVGDKVVLIGENVSGKIIFLKEII